MRQMNGAVRWISGRSVRLAAAGVTLAGITVAVSGSSPAAGQQVATAALRYTCTSPAGREHVSLQVKDTFPDTAVMGQPIRPSRASLTVTLPHAAAARLKASSVSLTAGLNTLVAVDGMTAVSTWPDLAAPATAVPADGDLTVTATGVPPAVTVNTPGDATFTAANLSFVLSPATSGGRVTSPVLTPTKCTLAAGQHAALATVAVTASSHPGSPKPGGVISTGPQSASHRQQAAKATDFCPGLTKNGLKINPRWPPPTPPPGSTQFHNPEPGCAWVVGFSNVKKLSESALIGPGLTNLDLGLISYINEKVNYFQTNNAGRLDFDGQAAFPPATATLLAFGFMPVTATLQLSELGNLDAYTVTAR